MPRRLCVELRGDGALHFTWKCDDPRGTAGTVYEVLRSVGDRPVNGTEYLGTAGRKSFTDTTIPAGATGLAYQITALRSTRRGRPARFSVRFGGSDVACGARPLGIAA